MAHLILRLTIPLWLALGVGSALADQICATPHQAKQVRDYYAEHPGGMPPVVATRLELPEAVVVSGLPADQAVSAPGVDFPEIWAAMTQWEHATFLIMKGANVFEISSAVGEGTPSTRSSYYNIAYTHPLRGHLRPDLYASVYAVALPGPDGAMVRGVLFYDDQGASVFGAFISGEGPTPSAEELAKFDQVMDLVRSKESVCPRS
jgi:putative heme iron utilization protein